MRTFLPTQAKREAVPLLIGLVSPSGAGKTMSALRLATGINKVGNKKIFVLDSESRRSLWYADSFDFQHLEFNAPFGPQDYEAAIRQCVDSGAGVVIVDSFSHEWEGEGGVLSMHSAEVERLSKGDSAKAERVNFLAWVKPKMAHAKMIQSILQMNCNFIFTFRAKEKLKLVTGKQPIELGWQAIGAPDLIYEMSLNMILLPNANGVPTWHSEHQAEQANMKLPIQFRDIFKTPRPLDEEHGQALALWAKGTSSNQGKEAAGAVSPEQAHPAASPSHDLPSRRSKMSNVFFDDYGITQAQIESFLKRDKNSWTGADIDVMTSIYQKLRKGAKVEDFFGTKVED